jgi:hypothetical protein
MEQENKIKRGYFNPSIKSWKSIRRAIRMLSFIGTLAWLSGLASAIQSKNEFEIIFVGISFFILIGWWLCQKWAWIGSFLIFLLSAAIWFMNKPLLEAFAFFGFGTICYILLLPGFGKQPESTP